MAVTRPFRRAEDGSNKTVSEGLSVSLTTTALLLCSRGHDCEGDYVAAANTR
jgi:hypothetical protein